MLTLYYDKAKVAALIAEAVVESDAQDQIAFIICDAYTRYQVLKDKKPGEAREVLLEMFVQLHDVLRKVESAS